MPRHAPVPFFTEVHEELTKLWRAPFTAWSHFTSSSTLTALDSGMARGYMDIPQVDHVVAVHLCLQNAATWRNLPRLPSRACKFTSSLPAKAYRAAGLAASGLHAMVILQIHQAEALKQLRKDISKLGLMQELRSATNFALRVMKVIVCSLPRASA